MLVAGLEPSNKHARQQFGLKTINEFKQDMTRFVRARNPDCTIFYNAGHIGPAHRVVTPAYSHFEIESLPSGEWGYLHFPVTIRYARNLGIDCVGQTGKFHTSWGDFHSFKNLPALRFECLRMLTHGAKCLIGDQLFWRQLVSASEKRSAPFTVKPDRVEVFLIGFAVEFRRSLLSELSGQAPAFSNHLISVDRFAFSRFDAPDSLLKN
jgi:hypothetical protein